MRDVPPPPVPQRPKVPRRPLPITEGAEKGTYNVVRDLQHIPANITIAQLADISPKVAKQLAGSLSRRKRPTPADGLFTEPERRDITTLQIDAKVKGVPAKTIVDSGSSISIVSRDFARKTHQRIDRPPTFTLRGVGGHTSVPISIIEACPITIGLKTYPTQVAVVESSNYTLLLGNDFLIKQSACVDYDRRTVRLGKGPHS